MEPETFEVEIRLFGAEIVGFKLASQSTKKLWVAIGIMSMMAFVALLNVAYPILSSISAISH
jgi:hypothetical protein